MTPLPAWPPTAEDTDVDPLVQLARDYALSHSIVYRPVDPDPTAVIHAPFALFPTPFPRRAFELAVRIQRAYSALYCCIATDWAFLERVVGGNVARVDEFQGELWKIAKQITDEGVAQSFNLGLFRSDYLLHSPPSPSQSSSSGPPISIKQVEFNTISSSFGALSSKVTQLHRHLALASDEYPAAQPPIALDALPENDALVELAAGLALAHNAYLESEGIGASRGISASRAAKILFVVQDGERNAFDQRALEWELLQSHGIKVLRRSFSELQTTAALVASESAGGSSSRTSNLLHITPQSPPAPTNAKPAGPTEISVVYFRAGYTPTDYPDARAWSTRLLLERSRAIKCPSVALQLAGAKKVQQVLSEPRELPALVQKHASLRALGEEAFVALRETFTALYPLDDSELGREALRLAYATPERFVLKPQREGGGNNIYREDIPPFLDALDEKDRKLAAAARAGQGGGATAADAPPPKHREGYILMDLIQPPEGVSNLLVRAVEREAKLGDVVSELGVYGVALFEDVPASSQTGSQSCRIVENRNAGHLLRTKGRESDEGGVAVGFSVIDSPFLVD